MPVRFERSRRRRRSVRLRRDPLRRCSALLALGLLAACGSDRAPSAATGGEEARAQVPLDRAASSSTGLTSSTTSVEVTDATEPGPAPIPTDPAALPSCASLPANVLRAEPSRRWLDVPSGWTLRYASSVTDDTGASSAPSGWSVLVRHSGTAVDAMVAVDVSREDETMLPLFGAERVIKGRPASVAPEATRGGRTGALQAEWRDDGQRFGATSGGLSEDELVQLVDRLDLDGVTVGHAPEGWTLLGSGMTENGHVTTTVLGLTPPGGDLDPAGYAPVVVTVEEASGEAPPTGPHPHAWDLSGGRLSLSSLGNHRGLLFHGDEADDGALFEAAWTTDRSGQPVAATGPVPAEVLLELAASVEAISADDPRLVGIPMAAAGSSPGAWCRP